MACALLRGGCDGRERTVRARGTSPDASIAASATSGCAKRTASPSSRTSSAASAGWSASRASSSPASDNVGEHRLGRERCEQERRLRLRREGCDPAAQQAGQRAGACGTGSRARAPARARAAGCPTSARGRGRAPVGEGATRRQAEKPMECTERQRSNGNPLDRERRSPPAGADPVRRPPRSPRQEEQHRLAAQSSHGEGEHRGRRGVEPLDVVDRQRHRRLGRQRAKEPEEPEGNRALVRRRLCSRPKEQSLLERGALGLRQRLGQILQSVGREVGSPAKRAVTTLGKRAGEHAMPGGLGCSTAVATVSSSRCPPLPRAPALPGARSAPGTTSSIVASSTSRPTISIDVSIAPDESGFAPTMRQGLAAACARRASAARR